MESFVKMLSPKDESEFKAVTVDFDKPKGSNTYDMKVGLLYDHQAYLISENLKDLKRPYLKNYSTKTDPKIQISKAFQSLISASKSDLQKLVASV